MNAVDAAFFAQTNLVSGQTRGSQIAERLEVPLNVRFTPETLPKNLVFVKIVPADLEQIPMRCQVWFDPIDADNGLEIVARNPQINLIAIGRTAYQYLHARFSNQIVLLVEQHCNFENHQNRLWPPKTVGFCGYQENFDFPFDKMERALKVVGLEFKTLSMKQDTSREDVVEFYRSIDIQVTFRGPRFLPGMPPEMKNPLKIVNAASFGIPTVGYPEISYMAEFAPYRSVTSFDEMITACGRLKSIDPLFRLDLIDKAENYNIDTVVENYRSVLK